MWIASKFGFFSIVQTRENKEQYMVRARAAKDLENLKKNISDLTGKNILETKHADYHFRIIISQLELNKLMQFFASEIDYPNFKNKVYSVPDQKDKLPFYHEIWETMYRYQKN